MSSRRSRLFNYLRIWFFSNLVIFVVLVCWFFYLRHQRSSLLEIVERQLAYNVRLSSDLSFANHVLTNRYFSVASDFASNVLVSAASNFVYASPSLSVGLSSPSVSAPSPFSSDLPPFDFHSYGECDGRPFIMLGRKIYFEGDNVLGFPIQFISPSVVVYREKYFKVGSIDIRSFGNEILKK